MLKDIINVLDPRMIEWWRKDEWCQVDSYHAHYIVEEHGCPSWDVSSCTVMRYKNKETCEIRQRRSNSSFRRTVFEDPRNNPESLGSKHIDNFYIYEGPDWERK